MNAPVIDQEKLQSFLMRAVGDLASAYGGVMVVGLGHKLGLYRAVAGAGPISARELAARTGRAERYVREWLNAQAAGGHVDYHAVSGTYELSPEQAMVLADEESPVFIPQAWEVPVSMWLDEEKAIEAFRTGKGVARGDHDGRLHRGVAGFYRNGYRASLVSAWLPALDGVVEQLETGIDVADVGCGHGYSTVLMAQAFPRSRFHGFDVHPASVEEARLNATKAGVAERATFEVARRGLPRPAVRPHLLLRRPARPGRPGGRRPPRRDRAGARWHGHARRAVRQRPPRAEPDAGRPALLRGLDHHLLRPRDVGRPRPARASRGGGR